MFRQKVQPISSVLWQYLRTQGLETPLLQHRLIAAWPEVAGPVVERYTGELFIKNQTLMVKITNPALRADISMMRTQLKERLNAAAGSQVITDVKIY